MLLWLIVNALCLLGAYLLGSVPSGYWAGRWLKGIDIREQGSGSTGATNVLRTVGKVPALVVLLVDIFKGAGAIVALRWLYSLASIQALAPNPVNLADWLPWMVCLAGFAALLGHSKSIWLGFTGGKSVATSLGILLAISWIVGLATLGTFGLVLAVSRIVSLSSIAGAIAVMGIMVVLQEPIAYQLFAIAGGTYVIWRHRTNIQRLRAGTEPQIGKKLVEPAQDSGAS